MKLVFDHQTFTLQFYGGISRYFVRFVQVLYCMSKTILTWQLVTAVSIRIILKSITDRISNRIRRQKW